MWLWFMLKWRWWGFMSSRIIYSWKSVSFFFVFSFINFLCFIAWLFFSSFVIHQDLCVDFSSMQHNIDYVDAVIYLLLRNRLFKLLDVLSIVEIMHNANLHIGWEMFAISEGTWWGITWSSCIWHVWYPSAHIPGTGLMVDPELSPCEDDFSPSKFLWSACSLYLFLYAIIFLGYPSKASTSTLSWWWWWW